MHQPPTTRTIHDERPSQRRSRAWSAFLEGLTRPSKGALGISLSVCGLGFLTCAVAFTPAFVAGPYHRYLAWGLGDTQLEVTSRVLKVARSEYEDNAVFVLGSSGIREAISNSEELRGLLEQRWGNAPSVYNLSSFDQTPLEMVALVEKLPQRFDGVVLLGINPCDVGAGPHQHHRGSLNEFELRFGFRSKIADGAARLAGRNLPPVTGNYFLDNYRFFLPRLPYLFRNILLGPPEEGHHPWSLLDAPIDEAGWDLQAERIRRLIADYQRHFDVTLGYYEDMARDLMRRGDVRVVLLESPICPRCIEETLGDAFWAEHARRMHAFAERVGIRYWNLNDRAGLVNDDFYDYVHLFNPDAQTRFTVVLSEALAELLQEERAG